MSLSAQKLAKLSERFGLPADCLARCYERASTPVQTVVDDKSKRRVHGGIRGSAPLPPATDLGAEPVLAWLPLDCLIIDKSYQREITRGGWGRINRIVAEFHWAKFQPLTVAGRDEDAGTFAVIDGQHRLEACRRHPKIKKVPCYVIGGGEPALEAVSFVALNRDRTALSNVNLFWAQLAAGDRRAKALRRICAGASVEVARFAQGRLPPMMLSSIGAAYDLLELGDAVAELTIGAIARAKPTTPSAFNAKMMAAIGELVLDVSEDLDLARLEKALAGLDFGKAAAQALLDSKTTGHPLTTCLGRILTDAYSGKPRPLAPLPAKRPAPPSKPAGAQRIHARLPSVSSTAPPPKRNDQAAVDAAVREGRVTKCPTAAVGATTATIDERNRKQLAEHAARQEEARREAYLARSSRGGSNKAKAGNG